jgi:hypothetical protein
VSIHKLAQSNGLKKGGLYLHILQRMKDADAAMETLILHKTRQATSYNIILRNIRVTIFAVEKQ